MITTAYSLLIHNSLRYLSNLFILAMFFILTRFLSAVKMYHKKQKYIIRINSRQELIEINLSFTKLKQDRHELYIGC